MAHAESNAQSAKLPSPRTLVLVGGGGHALVVHEAAAALGLAIAGFLDDDANAVAQRIGSLMRLGTLIELPAIIGFNPADFTLANASTAANGNANAMNAERNWILAIGGIAIRRRVLEEIALIEKSTSAQATYVALTLVHPTAYVSPTAEIGQGVYIGPKAVVHAFANVGNHAIINSGAIVEHECVIGENSHIAPGAVLGGNVRVGRDTLVGIGSRVLPGIQVGAGATVGGGATVVRTVVAGTTVVGVPARTR